MFSVPPPEVVVSFRLMFRESEDEHFSAASRQESVSAEICGSHLFVFVGCRLTQTLLFWVLARFISVMFQTAVRATLDLKG